MDGQNSNDKILTKITASIIANQIAYNLNHEIRFTGYYKHKLKMLLKQIDKELEKAEKLEYEKFYEVAEEHVDNIHAVQYDLINEISSTGIEHYQNITEIIKAYKINPKSINGIVNKINKNGKHKRIIENS